MKTNHSRNHSILMTIATSAFALLLANVSAAHDQVERTNSDTTGTVIALTAPAKRPLPDRVERFCQNVKTFPSSTEAHQAQAKQFATKLCESISANTHTERITANNLSPEAAKILANYFYEDIVAALAYKGVIAPAEILKTFLQTVRGEQVWRRLPLVTKHSLIPKPLTDVPEVLVTVADREKLTSALTESTAKAKTIAELKQAYKAAYHGRHGWAKAIAPYFAEDADDAED
jgi:hypothetical protein